MHRGAMHQAMPRSGEVVLSRIDAPTLYLLAVVRLRDPGGGWHVDATRAIVDRTGEKRLRIVATRPRDYVLRFDVAGDVRATKTWDVEYGLDLVGWPT